MPAKSDTADSPSNSTPPCWTGSVANCYSIVQYVRTWCCVSQHSARMSACCQGLLGLLGNTHGCQVEKAWFQVFCLMFFLFLLMPVGAPLPWTFSRPPCCHPSHRDEDALIDPSPVHDLRVGQAGDESPPEGALARGHPLPLPRDYHRGACVSVRACLYVCMCVPGRGRVRYRVYCQY